MLILPIINKNRILNVEIRLRGIKKVKNKAHFYDAGESEIIVNREKFSESHFSNLKTESAPTEFIRSRSILYPRKFLVTTKERVDNTFYDVYELVQPPRKVNDSLEILYGKAITDLQKEIPGVKDRGRYISFEKLGLDSVVSDDKIKKLQKIVQDEEYSEWTRLFNQEHIDELCSTIEFLNHFEYIIISESIIPESSLQESIKALSTINTRDYRNLKNYYDMAKKNTEIYTKLSYINKLVYDRPLSLFVVDKSNIKQYVKKKDDYEY